MNYENILKELALKDEKYIILTAENRAAIRNLPQLLNERFIDMGICEQTLVGTAVGLALRGRVPIVHALAAFLTMRSFEFIRTDVGISNLPVKLVGFVPGFLSDANGPTHQAIEDISLMRTIPNINIFCPADEEDMDLCLRSIIESSSPFYIRYNNLPASVKHSKEFQIGKAETISEGRDITILTYGMLLNQANKAMEILKAKGIDTGLINLRTLKPFDEALILKIAHEGGLIVTLEDHFLTGGLFSIVAELFLKSGISCKVLPISLENRWFKPALLDQVLEYEGFTGEKIALNILNNLK
jgi:transketolase